MASADVSLEGLLDKINRATLTLHDGKAEDVSRVSRLLGAMGQSFTPTIFAFQQASSARDGVAFVAVLAEKYGAEVLAAHRGRGAIPASGEHAQDALCDA